MAKMKNIFSKDNLITIAIAVPFYFLLNLLKPYALWIGIGFTGIGLVYIGWVLYRTNWCEPGSCNGMFFLPGIFSIVIGAGFISASFEAV
jgi:hypothetical protein